VNDTDRNAEESAEEELPASTIPAAVEPAASKQVLDLRAKEAEALKKECHPEDERATDAAPL